VLASPFAACAPGSRRWARLHQPMQPKTKREGENGRETGTFILGLRRMARRVQIYSCKTSVKSTRVKALCLLPNSISGERSSQKSVNLADFAVEERLDNIHHRIQDRSGLASILDARRRFQHPQSTPAALKLCRTRGCQGRQDLKVTAQGHIDFITTSMGAEPLRPIQVEDCAKSHISTSL
jgi:hypothetical protein